MKSDFDFSRFVEAQEGVYDTALAELRQGRKESHWMWFIFPQLDGLGMSPMAKKFALRNLEEAKAYLADPILGMRLFECCRALLAITGKSAYDIMGYPDDLKLRSSMTLFAMVPEAPQEFGKVLLKYYSGESDGRTIELIQNSKVK